jgi:hypothetical protein
MTDFSQSLLRLLLVAAVPWCIAIGLTYRRKWFTQGWLDASIRIQTALACQIFATQAAGAAGILRFTEAFLPQILYVLVTFRYASRQELKTPGETESGKKSGQFLVTACCTLLSLEFLRLFVPSLIGAVKVVSDGPIYHLYFAARWWQEGRISWIPIPFGESAAPYFPANGDLWFLTLVGWTGNLSLAKVGQVPFWFLGGWWLYRLCRTLGGSRASSTMATTIWMTLSPLALFTFEPNVDTIFAAWFIASVLFFIELDLNRTTVERTSSQSNLLLLHSLLAAGLAWGTKAPGIVFIPPWVALVIVRELILIRAAKAGGTGLSLFKTSIFLALVAISPVLFWWARNAIATGNPLYPLPVEVAGITLMDGWYGTAVMKQSPYYLPMNEYGALGDILLSVLDPRLAWLYPLVILWSILSLFRNKTRADRWNCILIAFGLLTIAIYWFLVPYRTQQRFFLHGLALFAPAMALFFDKFKWLKCVGIALLTIHLLSPQGWPFLPARGEPPWDMSRFVPNRMPGLVPLSEIVGWFAYGDLRGVALIAFAAGMAVASASRGKIAIAGFGLCLIAFNAACFLEDMNYEKTGRGKKFPVFPDYERAWAAFDRVYGEKPVRVAYSGTNLAVYLMGRHLQNHVEYVNCNSHTDWMPHDYHLAQPPGQRRWPHPRPTWERMETSYEAWLANLNQMQIEVVVVARANPDEGRSNPFDALGFPVEKSWMDSHPEQFEPVYGLRETDREMCIYQVVK